jgi:hypothetical protein
MAKKTKKAEMTTTETTTPTATENPAPSTAQAPPPAPATTTLVAPVATTTAPAPSSAAQVTQPTETKPARSNIIPAKSTVEKPTKAVWAIADEMRAKNPNATRKEIVDECVRRGIAFYTARTQYQRWSKTKQSAS